MVGLLRVGKVEEFDGKEFFGSLRWSWRVKNQEISEMGD
jgi:hypothetical protein